MFNYFINNNDLLAISTDRLDGYSNKPFDSFNLAYHVNDNKIDVDRNYTQLANCLGIEKSNIFLLNQTHSDIFYEVKKNSKEIPNSCDAFYTKESNIYLATMSADCLPVLLYCKEKHLVAAIHSGWLGSSKLILYKLIVHLIVNEKIDTSNLKVYIGPSISQDNYEVNIDLYNKIIQHEFIDSKSCFKKNKNGKYLFDNLRFNLLLLDNLNINENNISIINECTYENDKYYSYRKEGNCGRQICMIGLKK